MSKGDEKNEEEEKEQEESSADSRQEVQRDTQMTVPQACAPMARDYLGPRRDRALLTQAGAPSPDDFLGQRDRYAPRHELDPLHLGRTPMHEFGGAAPSRGRIRVFLSRAWRGLAWWKCR